VLFLFLRSNHFIHLPLKKRLLLVWDPLFITTAIVAVAIAAVAIVAVAIAVFAFIAIDIIVFPTSRPSFYPSITTPIKSLH
jgi:hypothetical protein